MLNAPLLMEDTRPNYALAHAADEAISRVFGSPEHDDAVAALEEVLRVKESGADSLELLQTLVRTSAIAKWAALNEKFSETAAMVSQGLPEGGRGDGSKYASQVGTDSYSFSADGMVSRFRRHETQTLETEPCYPGDVAAQLCEFSDGVLRWLKDEQRRCGQQAPLVKHDRLVRLCHQATGSEPPQHALALDPTTDTDPVHNCTDDPTAAEDPSATHSWAQRAQHALARVLQLRPRLSLFILLALVVPTTVWSSWQLLSDVNRYASAFVAIVISLAVARPMLRNLYWALTLTIAPARAAAWVVDTIDTGWSE